MPSFLHLLKGDSAHLAGPVIQRNAREPGAQVTVVLLDGAEPPSLPAGTRLRRLAPGDDLDHAGLLELIFEADHVIGW